VTVGKLYTVGTAGELYIAGEVCGSGQAVGAAWHPDPVLAQLSQWPTATNSDFTHNHKFMG
jgi:hypothetical protein